MTETNGTKRVQRLSDQQVYDLIEHCKKHADEIRKWSGTKQALAEKIGSDVGIPGLSVSQLEPRMKIAGVDGIGSAVIPRDDELALLRAAIRRNERYIAALHERLRELWKWTMDAADVVGPAWVFPSFPPSPLDPPGTLPFDDNPPSPAAGRDLSAAASINQGEFLKP